MTIRTIAAFLIGRREAIRMLAHDRWSIPVGLLFVLSAALARNYDGRDLLREPYVLLGGFAVAIVNAFLLYALFWLIASKSTARPPFPSGYRAFLGLFLMTAPMAWLYGIPFERFLAPMFAVQANLWMLALVSAWRVALMTRVMSVLWEIPTWRAFFPVMLFADIVALVGLGFIPKPMISIMGGIEMSQVDQLLGSVIFQTQVLCVLSLPVWQIGSMVARARIKSAWGVAAAEDATGQPRPRAAILAAAAAILGWGIAAAFTQPEQRSRSRTEALLHDGRIAEALSLMSAHSRGNYPPLWEPPPRPAYGEGSPPLQSIATVMLEQPPALWVIELYLPRIRHQARVDAGFWRGDMWATIEARVRDDPSRFKRNSIDSLLRSVLVFDGTLTDRDRAAVEQLLFWNKNGIELERVAPHSRE